MDWDDLKFLLAVADAGGVDLRRREADLAVRMFRDDHDGLVLRRLGSAIGIRCGSPRAAIQAALADVGVCIVPCFLAAAHTSLVRLTDQALATAEVHAAFLPERRGEARLRVVIDALLEMFERDRAALSGTVPDA